MVIIEEEVSVEGRLSNRESLEPASPSGEGEDLKLRSGPERVRSTLDNEDLGLIRAFYFIPVEFDIILASLRDESRIPLEVG